MTPFARFLNVYWVGGIATAFLGVLVARFIGPLFDGNTRLYLLLAGQLLAISGLFIIALGIRNRVKKASESLAEEHTDEKEGTGN